MVKDLPIQHVHFRGHTDQFLTEGGGSKKLPKWVNEEAILKNVAQVTQQLSQFQQLFEKERTLPVLTEVTIHPDATAKSHRPAIRSILDSPGKRNVIGVTSLGKLLVKIDNSEDYHTISTRFNTDLTHATRNKEVGLSAIKDIGKYKATVDPDIHTNDIVKIQLVDYQDYEYNNRSRIQLENICRKLGIQLQELDYASNLRLFSITKTTEKALTAIATIDAVLSVRKMPTIVFEAAPQPENSEIEVMKPIEGVDYPLVGIMDTGISTETEYLTPWLVHPEDNTAEFVADDIDNRHGTAVAGVLNYGDFLEQKDFTQCGPCKIQSCIINTSPQLVRVYENELVMSIQKAVAAHPEIKIWNLSQGTALEIDDDKYSDLAIALDSIQRDNQILICKSAGNASNLDTEHPSLRITHGADSLLSLVVGSIAHKKTTDKDAEVNDRSPFSRIGPGVENCVKPDLVHYGGNTDTHLSLFSPWGRQFYLMSGTSFSTPRVTALAANLSKEIGGSSTPLLLKALLIHYADYPEGINKPSEQLRKEMGFGLPKQIETMLHNDADECTMIFSHRLEKGTDILSLDFPYPQHLIDEEGYYEGEITVTLAVNPLLDASQGIEYCQSQVDILLETYSQVEHVTLGEGTMRNEERMSRDSVNVLKPELYNAKSKKPGPAGERTLIEKGYKYQPIKKYHVNLSQMTPANKLKTLSSEKKWALKLVGLYRDAAETSMQQDGVYLSQDIVAIITIKDPRHRHTTYSECLQLMEQRGYVHNNVAVDNRIDIENK